ncbi:hypothetical protein [Pseudanabaena mucicola]|uniref:Uncharacterized protein n=1 Tax=Pseudanabaena mucicola FACHB-723 TaxID=2692860 RepID=A0ABR8A0A7_9CYAN|nr:hypothetical protein [Pseudanabaena mucicola]MBD2189423.1 hypothetical protein [Pseudanabaena mucicola FACHB-723]
MSTSPLYFEREKSAELMRISLSQNSILDSGDLLHCVEKLYDGCIKGFRLDEKCPVVASDFAVWVIMD